jgi:hypothetical protein
MAEPLSVDLTGLPNVLRLLEGIESRSLDIRPIARDIALAVQADVDERFDSAPGVRAGGTVYGDVSWDSLTNAYLAQRPEREGGQIYRDTGELQQSFQVGGGDNVFEATNDQVTFGSSLTKASPLHRRRPILVVHDDLVTAVGAIMEVYILEGRR